MGISWPTPYVCFPIFFYHHPVPVALLVCRFDPPRLDTAETIAEAGDLGVRVKMLTGDAVAIAKETCRQLALGTNVYDSERLITGNMSGSNVRAPSHTEFWGEVILIRFDRYMILWKVLMGSRRSHRSMWVLNHVYNRDRDLTWLGK